MNPVAQGLALGYSAQKLIGFLSKAFPSLAPRIKQAQRNGHSVEQVLGFLSKTMETDLPKGTSQQEVLAATNKNKEQLTKHGLTLAASAVAAPLAANAARSVLSRALPQTLSPQAVSLANASNTSNAPVPAIQQTSQSPTGINPTAQPQQNTSPQPPNPISANVPNTPQAAQQPPLSNANAASIPEPVNINQSKGFDTNIIKNGVAYKSQIDALIKSGNGPEEIEAYLKKFSPQTVKTIEKEGKGAFKDVVAQYMQEKIRDDAMQPEGSIPNAQTAPIQEQPQIQEAEQLQEPIEQPEVKAEAPKIEKNSVVSSPDGIGEVREIRGEKALVEIDGKLKKVDVSELEPPLYTDDDIADAYDRLMAVIPEKERSGFISWAGYDENTNELGFIPRGGKYEVITDISPEEAKMIKEGTGTARTNGEVREGLWVQGGETRGGVISQIIHDRRRAKESEEKKQGKFDFNLPKPEKQDRGMKPQFDEMEYPRNLSRAREKKAKDEERARKKKEKDEAKKRKK